MDFVRGSHQANQPTASTPGVNPEVKKGSHKDDSKWIRIVSVVMLFAISIILVAVALSIYIGKDEGDFLNKSKFQAVDISVGGTNGDQIYFGKVTRFNSKFVVIEHVFYIPTTTTSQSSNLTLQPLVCQIDAPYDQMIVNRSSVNWWENLQDSSKVVQTITTYQKQNPTGPTCPTSSTTTTSPSTTNKSSSSTTTTKP